VIYNRFSPDWISYHGTPQDVDSMGVTFDINQNGTDYPQKTLSCPVSHQVYIFSILMMA